MQRIRAPAEAHKSLLSASAELAQAAHSGRQLQARSDVEPPSDGFPDRLQRAVQGLATKSPEFSAATGLPRWQMGALVGMVATVCGGVILAPDATLVALLAIMAIPFLLVVALRVVALWHLLGSAQPVSAEKATQNGDSSLPVYTALVPLKGEAAIVPHLLDALASLDYPADSLEVLLIVESFDHETQLALTQATLPTHMRVLVVPDGTPRTKPRALQYALQFAHGAYVVVYDAEDVPEPDQLRCALAALQAAPGRLGCVQAQLNIYNSRSSWLTRGIMAQTPQELGVVGT